MALRDLTLGFIGGGQMAEALIRGLLKSKATSADKIIVSEPFETRQKYLSGEFPGLKAVFDNCGLVRESDFIILAVKPQIMKDVLKEISLAIDPARHLVLSIAAGIPLAFLEAFLPEKTRVIRVMPNTAALVLASISVFTGGRYTTPEDLALAEEFLKAFGDCLLLPEIYFDAVTGLSGSGPAFVAAFIEALTDGGVKAGLPRPVAERLALETVLGTAKLFRETGKNPYEVKGMVTSPGGTTICGLKALAERAFAGSVMEAVEAATNRSAELTKKVLKEVSS
ncbi:MAG: pyrroline-5-carboxylate reductase [Thermodesulfobacteria bacterium]|nr:pyrroline-5-carboxylate reductase [Thermodesulfobacteriota bacterium]